MDLKFISPNSKNHDSFIVSYIYIYIYIFLFMTSCVDVMQIKAWEKNEN